MSPTPRSRAGASARSGLVPMGPGSGPLTRDLDPTDPRLPRRPSFAADPAGWFTWLDRAVAAGGPSLAAIRPAVWTDPRGHHWRVVVTHDGPEVRPALENPFLISSDLPTITALLVGRDAVHLELTSRGGRRVARCPLGGVSIADLGIAMLTATELPHDGLDRLGPDTWAAARRRWQLLRAAAGTIRAASRETAPA